MLHFIGQYVASQESLNGLASLHRTIHTTGQVRRLREIILAQNEFLRKRAIAPLSSEEKIVFINTQKQADGLFASCLELSAFRNEANRLISDANSIFTPFKSISREAINSMNEADAKPKLLISGQYILEIQDLLGKVQFVLASDSDQIVNRIYAGRFGPLIAGILMSLIFVGFALWTGAELRRRTEGPIQNLVEATRFFAEGNWHFRANISSQDELGLLTHAFNCMAEKIEDTAVSKAYVENILESMLNCVLVLDASGTITSVNRLTVNTFGYSREELIGSNIELILPCEFLLKDNEINAEAVAIRKNQNKFPVFVSVASLEQTGMAQGQSVCVIKDITENKKFENEIRERNLALSVANHELEAFSYSVSHDLRAPLRIIDGFSQALAEDASDTLTADNKKHLERIRSGVQKMGHLIDAVLNLSRLSRSSMTATKVDLSAVVSDVVDELKKSEPNRQSEFTIQKGLIVDADPVLMKITIENLVGNAWKYSSKKEKSIIEFGSTQTNGEKTYFIRDNGAGFDMEYAQKLFVPFQRLHNQNDFAGTGVGLASVNRVIHRHGGRIWADSRVNEGTVFYFTLPAKA